MDKHIIKAEFTMNELVRIIIAMENELERLKESNFEIHKEYAESLKSALSKINRPGGTKSI